MIAVQLIACALLGFSLVAACAASPVAPRPTTAPSTSFPSAPPTLRSTDDARATPTTPPPTNPCTVAVIKDEVGNGQTFAGTGFLPDATIELTLLGSGQPVTLAEADFADLRTDIRGAWELHLFADRADVGAHTARATDGDCSAAVDFTVTADVFPEAPCTPADDPATLGSAKATDYDAIVAADDPVAYWPLDEAGVTSATSEQGATAEFVGDVVVGEPGFVEGSRSVLLPDLVDPSAEGAWLDLHKMTFDGDFTVEAWIRFCGTRIGPRDALFGQAAEGPEIIFPDWNLSFFDGVHVAVVSSRSVSRGGWQHVALVRSNATVTLYQDGEAVGTGTYSGSLPIDAIGAGASGTFGGWIDNVAFYDTALGQDRIAARASFPD